MNPIALLFDFRGRINRAKFWLAAAIWIGFFVLVIGIATASGSLAALYVGGLIAYVLILVSAVAVGIKRLHDRDKSPWWLAVFLGVPLMLPFAGALLADMLVPSEGSFMVGVLVMQCVSFGILLWTLVELGVIRGTIGANPHGSDPIAPAPAPARGAH
jgi:uncharacterized membrane protein YhaH (DUF805 family)